MVELMIILATAPLVAAIEAALFCYLVFPLIDGDPPGTGFCSVFSILTVINVVLGIWRGIKKSNDSE